MLKAHFSQCMRWSYTCSYHFQQQESPNSECRANEYTGQICSSELAARQNCVLGREGSEGVLVSLTDAEQAFVEQQLAMNLQALSPICENELKAFVCGVVYRLCDSDGVEYQLTRRECEIVSESTSCTFEFQAALALLGLSGCDSFPNLNNTCGKLYDVTVHM